MVRTGPLSKLEKVKTEILKLLNKNVEVLKNGLGFRNIHRSLAKLSREKRAGSHTTLQKCLRELEKDKLVAKDPETKKYYGMPMGSSAWLDKIDVKGAIEKANIFGGGRLCHPDIKIVKEGLLIPREGIRPFMLTDLFIHADLGQTGMFEDEGVQFLEIMDERVSKKTRELWPSSKESVSAKARKISPACASIKFHKLSPTQLLDSWLRRMFEFAKEEKLASEEFYKHKKIDEIPDHVLDTVWHELFDGVKSILLTELIYPQRLLEWLKTPEGKTRLTSALEE